MSFPRGDVVSDESDFGSCELRSEYFSSEDENCRIGYIGPPNPKKRRRNRVSLKVSENDDIIKWRVEMKFASMQEFSDKVRKYGIKDKRGVRFMTNDASRCQIVVKLIASFIFGAVWIEIVTIALLKHYFLNIIAQSHTITSLLLLSISVKCLVKG